MIKFILTVILSVFIISCTNESSARKILANQGYTNIRITGYDWFACGRDDIYATGFIATSQAGKEVEGCICEGFFKNATIRFK